MEPQLSKKARTTPRGPSLGPAMSTGSDEDILYKKRPTGKPRSTPLSSSQNYVEPTCKAALGPLGSVTMKEHRSLVQEADEQRHALMEDQEWEAWAIQAALNAEAMMADMARAAAENPAASLVAPLRPPLPAGYVRAPGSLPNG